MDCHGVDMGNVRPHLPAAASGRQNGNLPLSSVLDWHIQYPACPSVRRFWSF
jgi:hypothetical protein